MNMKTSVFVIYGGKSAEHDVSLKTAFNVLNRMDKSKYDVYPVYITRQGLWHGADDWNMN
jgi:D-alanine-D-alanine ligase